MDLRLLDLLCCPYDKSFPLKVVNGRPDPGRPATTVAEGELVCPSCRRSFPIRDGIPRLLPDGLAVGRAAPPGDEAGRVKWLQQRQRNDEAERFIADFVPFSTQVDSRMTLRSLAPRPTDLILDAGSGPGRLTRCLTGRCRELVALDFSHRVLEVLARDLGPRPDGTLLHPVVGDVEHKPLRDDLFDKVLSFGILEHLPDADSIRAVLAETRRTARPGAKVMITAYACTPLRRVLARVLGIDYQANGWHDDILFHRASLAEMRDLVETSFENYQIRGIRNVPRHLGQKLQPFSTAVDLGISATPLSRLSGYYYLVEAVAA